MKRQPIEVYGFGRRLPTRTDRLVRIVTWAGVAAILILLWVMPW